MSENHFNIELTGPGVSIKQEISKQLAQEIVAAVFSGSLQQIQKPSSQEKPHRSASRDDDGIELSIREFVDKYEPKRKVDFIATFGLFLKEHRGQSTFTREDLISCFEDSGESIPANLSRDIEWAVSAGLIATKNGFKDQYYVTQSGKTATHQKFPQELKKKTAIKQKPTKKKPKAE